MDADEDVGEAVDASKEGAVGYAVGSLPEESMTPARAGRMCSCDRLGCRARGRQNLTRYVAYPSMMLNRPLSYQGDVISRVHLLFLFSILPLTEASNTLPAPSLQVNCTEVAYDLEGDMCKVKVWMAVVAHHVGGAKDG